MFDVTFQLRVRLKFLALNLKRWRHFENSSERLFKSRALFDKKSRACVVRNVPNCFRNAATVLSLARETLNARAIEMSRQTSVRCMAFANNKKEQLSRQSPEDRFIA